MNKLQLFNDRIIVQLDKAPTLTTNEFGVVSALMENYETDGSKIGSRLSPRSYLNKGTVIQVSDFSAKKLEDLNVTLVPGDEVFVTHNAVNEQYNFSYTRDGLARDFTGLISIPHILIEGKIIS